jgi:hypothetical protein
MFLDPVEDKCPICEFHPFFRSSLLFCAPLPAPHAPATPAPRSPRASHRPHLPRPRPPGNVSTGKLNGLKSHDYHIIMERLLSVMLRGYLDIDLWEMFAELSYFSRHLCAKQVSKMMMQKFEKEITILVCKMEKEFPPGWFNVMQHLLVHLPWEAKVDDLYNSGGCIVKKGN